MADRARLAMAAVCVLGGCSTPTRLRPSGVVPFEGRGGDLTGEFTFHSAPSRRHGDGEPPLVADVGRCVIFETDDGHSRLEYPADALCGAGGDSSTRPPFTVTFAPDWPAGGSIDLAATGYHPVAIPRPTGDLWGDAIVAMEILPGFVGQPFAALPDRLAATLDGPAPVVPAVVELAHDLVDYKGTAAVGDLRDARVFTARLTLTDAGRAKLRVALARRDAATRPAAGLSAVSR